MSDADAIRKLRAWARDMRKAQQEALKNGAAFHLSDTGSVVDTVTAYLDGAASGGWQYGDEAKGEKIREAIRQGKMGHVGGVGFGPPTKP